MRTSDKNDQLQRTPRPAVSRKPSQEIEVKLRIADRQAVLARLDELGAICEGRVHEMNTLYDTRDRALMRKGRLLRIRTTRPANRPGTKAFDADREPERSLLTFKGPVRRSGAPMSLCGRRYKIREEREVRATDGDELAIIFEALGFHASFRYEKYRSTYRLPGVNHVTLELDETPVGDFLEAEGARAAIDRAASLLGYHPSDYLTKSYWDLFQEHLRKSGDTKRSKKTRVSNSKRRDMLFSPSE